MILKVPIYVEFEKISTDEVQIFVEEMNKKFTSIVRKYKPEKIRFKIPGFEEDSYDIENFKIISREDALESLRTKKK
jgi:hypothetical protein